MRTADQQRIVDEEHVKLLSIFFYISGGISAFCGLFPLLYVLMGALVLMAPEGASAEVALAARTVGLMMAGIGIITSLFFEGAAALKFLAGYWLHRRRHRVPCLVIAGIVCLGFPYTTILSLFTFIVLLRGSVRDLFEGSAAVADATQSST